MSMLVKKVGTQGALVRLEAMSWSAMTSIRDDDAFFPGIGRLHFHFSPSTSLSIPTLFSTMYNAA